MLRVELLGEGKVLSIKDIQSYDVVAVKNRGDSYTLIKNRFGGCKDEVTYDNLIKLGRKETGRALIVEHDQLHYNNSVEKNESSSELVDVEKFVFEEIKGALLENSLAVCSGKDGKLVMNENEATMLLNLMKEMITSISRKEDFIF